MNSHYKLVLSLSFTAIGFLGLQGSAMAVTSINANICQSNFNERIIRSGGFIQNASANTISVVCPVIRIADAPTSGWKVYVDGRAPAPTTARGSLTCQLESYNFDGAFLAATAFIVGAPGTFDRLLTLPKEKVPFYSHQALVCSLPPNSFLFDIQPTTP